MLRKRMLCSSKIEDRVGFLLIRILIRIFLFRRTNKHFFYYLFFWENCLKRIDLCLFVSISIIVFIEINENKGLNRILYYSLSPY